MTQHYFAADLTIALNINSKIIWREVRKHGITPEMVGNKYAITVSQVARLERALNVTIPRKQKPKPPAPKPPPMPKIPRKMSEKEKAIAPTPQFTLTAECKVSEAEYKRNRERIARVEALVRAGKVKPRVEPAGAAVPKPWQWSAGI